ncbi:hypothetical protein EVAR_86858_1 [Eumeta japonica]|uniref:Uncharacterized protein n=1 Tax=Eumeta variegata TaxID=151549 RepID=A0A4C1VS11_EUMVA|nr:hypothetical protein EVAR_86858_1 [Eumeta japonica]
MAAFLVKDFLASKPPPERRNSQPSLPTGRYANGTMNDPASIACGGVHITLSTPATTSSSKPPRSLTSLFLHLSFRDTPHILRGARVSTASILLLFYFCHSQLSLSYMSVGIRTPLWIAKRTSR